MVNFDRPTATSAVASLTSDVAICVAIADLAWFCRRPVGGLAREDRVGAFALADGLGSGVVEEVGEVRSAVVVGVGDLITGDGGDHGHVALGSAEDHVESAFAPA